MNLQTVHPSDCFLAAASPTTSGHEGPAGRLCLIVVSELSVVFTECVREKLNLVCDPPSGINVVF